MKKIFFPVCFIVVFATSEVCTTATAALSNYITVVVANTNLPITTTASSITNATTGQSSVYKQNWNNLGLKFFIPVWSAFFGALFGVIGGLALRVIAFWLKRRHLTKRLNVEPDIPHGRQFRCRVRNGGYWTVKNAIIYITLSFDQNDTCEPPPGHNAIIRPDNFVPLKEDQLCWSVRAPDVNPIKVDIYAKEPQPFSPGALTNPGDMLMIPSEEGWPRFKDDPLKMRVFLRRKQYSGYLMIVSEDTNARFFRLDINPDDNSAPIQLKLSSEKECKLLGIDSRLK
jgi:hypothetical protein